MEGDNDMLKKVTYIDHILFTIAVTAMLLIGSIAVVNAAETDPSDIDSGTYDGVPWRITADYELLIGEEGQEYTFSYEYNEFMHRTENSWPWISYCSQITEVSVLGTVHGRGSFRGMFNEFQKCNFMDLRGLDTSEVTDMGLMFSVCYQLQNLDVSGFVTSNVKNMRYMFCQCKSLTSLDVSGFDTSNVKDMFAMFSNCQSLNSLNVSGFDTSNVTNLEGVFTQCKSLTSLDVSGFDTGNATDMNGMFDGCKSLTSLDVSGFDTGNVTDMGDMFRGCENITSLDVSGFDTGNVTNMNAMFYNCKSLTNLDISGFDTSNVMYMGSLFGECDSLTSVDMSGLNASNVTNMVSLFQGCDSLASVDMSGLKADKVESLRRLFADLRLLTSVDMSNLDSGSVTDMSAMFYNCNSLTNVKLSGLNSSNVQNMSGLFASCTSLTSVDLAGLNTSNVSDMSGMFQDCVSLTSIDLSGFDTGKVRYTYNMFRNCSALTSIDTSMLDIENLGNGMFYNCSALTNIVLPDSLKRTESYVFSGCSSLKEVRISNLDHWCSIDFADTMSNPLNASPDAVLLLNGGTGSKVTLDEGVTQIPDRSFHGWKYLKEITLPKSLTKIGAGAFEGTNILSTVKVDSLDQWLNMEFATESSSPLASGKAELRVRSGSEYDALSEVIIDKAIGSIPAYAFSGCKSLRSVVIPDSVTTIGTGAFANCSALSQIVIPDSILTLPERMFADCKGLEKVLIPDSVTDIDSTAFKGCSNDLIIYGTPGSAAETFASQQGIRFQDYSEYDAIQAGTITDNIRWILTGGNQLTIEGTGAETSLETDASTFAKIAEKVTSVQLKGITGIGGGAFSNFTNLKRVTIDINTTIESISPEAFDGCGDVEICCYSNSYNTVTQDLQGVPGITVKKLSGSRAGNVTWSFNENTGTLLLSSASAEFGETFTESPFKDLNIRRVEFSDSFACRDLPANLFAGCSSITEVKLAAHTTQIGDHVFQGCTNLRRVIWHEGVSEIGKGVFENCANLRQVLLADSVLVNEYDQEMEDIAVEIPAGVTTIPQRAFCGCAAIRQVDWFEDAQEDQTGQAGGSIGAAAFENCSALAEIGIPEYVTVIEEAAFQNCTQLSGQDGELFFSENLNTLGVEAFNECSGIRTMNFAGDLSAIGNKSLGTNANLIVEAPESAANLKEYCRAAGMTFLSLEGIGDTQIEESATVTLAAKNISVKAGKSKKIAYKTNGKVKRITASKTDGKVSVAKSGHKVKFTGKKAASKRSIKVKFDMKKAKDVTKSVSVTVKKASSGLDGPVGDAQILKVSRTAATFTSDAAAAQMVRITRDADAKGAFHCSASVKGIVKYTMKADGTLQITPVKAGKTNLTVYADGDEVFEKSKPVTVRVTVKARPAKVTAGAKKLTKTKARVSWKKIYGIKSYQIQVSTSKSFKKKKTYTAGSAALKKTVKITKKKKNYIRVRYKLANGKVSKWSTTLVIKK